MNFSLNNIYNMDVVQGLSQMDKNSIDLVVTSPPYNKGFFSSNGNTGVGNQIWEGFTIDYDTYDDNMNIEEYEEWMIHILNLLYDIVKEDGSVFFNHKPIRYNNKIYHPIKFILQSKFNIYQEIIWDRKNSPNIRKDILTPCTERIYWLSKGKPRVYRDELDREFCSEVWNISPKKQNDHPAPFPLQIPINCINLTTKENDIVLDPFMGSGTTGLAARMLNRKYIGFELSKNYCDLATKRIEENTCKVVLY